MRRIIAYIFLLSLMLSCGKASTPDTPVLRKGGSAWQKTQWDRCSQELQKHLDPSVRIREMRTLDAAYLAILSAPESQEDAYTVSFTTDGAPCEARISRSAGETCVTILREGQEVGVFSQDGTSFTGESTGIRFTAAPFQADLSEVHIKMDFSAEGTTLVTLMAEGPVERVDVNLSLPAGICLKGSVEARRLWDGLLAVADGETKEAVVPLVEEADAALQIDVFYEGDLGTPHARLSLRPWHLVSRYDDYWTWDPIILTESGEVLNEAWATLGSIDSATLAFVQAWRNLLPHLLS